MSCPVYGNRKITTTLATLYIEEGGRKEVRFFSISQNKAVHLVNLIPNCFLNYLRNDDEKILALLH